MLLLVLPPLVHDMLCSLHQLPLSGIRPERMLLVLHHNHQAKKVPEGAVDSMKVRGRQHMRRQGQEPAAT